MSPSIKPNDIKPALERRQTYRPLRLGKTFPGLPVRDRRRNSDASIWVLAICIVIALILRCTSDAASQENLASYTPMAIEYLKDSETDIAAVGA